MKCSHTYHHSRSQECKDFLNFRKKCWFMQTFRKNYKKTKTSTFLQIPARKNLPPSSSTFFLSQRIRSLIFRNLSTRLKVPRGIFSRATSLVLNSLGTIANFSIRRIMHNFQASQKLESDLLTMTTKCIMTKSRLPQQGTRASICLAATGSQPN